ncbi:hypothetical protein EPA93_35045 [Ktedonosporobacter rubrisoli]|uniref:Uncharacterized protein n=1 Tax=Ktedonosporobacter rubrisoli TaxID=2509675 RepID=A0A4P6JYL7_KTERU|nr:hypothetical protein [Ktedonosporobacter rubrisoli]QBD80908.1 hypothetical protein EPA93_35045 [Ktedonosporobacter rubrisoli]
MQDIAAKVVSIADACLGGLQGRSALLIGPEEQRYPFLKLLQQARMKYVYQEETTARVTNIIPQVQLLISIPTSALSGATSDLPLKKHSSLLSAACIAQACDGRRTPLLIFDLGPTTSVEELAGLLPAVCLYTPDDLRHILERAEARA